MLLNDTQQISISIMRTVQTLLLFLWIPMLSAQNFDDYKWELFNTSNTILKSDHIREIFFDIHGNTWVTTENQGFYRYNGKTWISFSFPSEWRRDGWLNSIFQDSKGKFWISGYDKYIITFEPSTMTWDRIAFPYGQPWLITGNKSDVMLIGVRTGSEKGMLYQMKDGKFTLLEAKMEDPLSITIQPNGDAWVCYRKGAFKHEMEPDGGYAKKTGKKLGENLYQVVKDKQGKLWASSFNTLHLHEYGGAGYWREVKIKPEDISYRMEETWRYTIHDLMVLPDNRLLITTQFQASIAIYDRKKWMPYKIPLETTNDGIERIRQAPNGDIWCATWANGIAVFKSGNEEIKKQPKKDPFANIIATEKPVANKPVSRPKRIRYIKREEKKPTPVPVEAWMKPVAENTPVMFTPDPSRIAQTWRTLNVNTQNIIVEVKDYQQVDGDTISLYFNGELILEKELMTNKTKRFKLRLKKGENEVLMYAHNLGRTPPSTVALTVIEDNYPKKIKVNSDLKKCGRVLIDYDEK